MHFVSCRVRRRPASDDIRQLFVVAEISVCARNGEIEIGFISINLAFAGFSQNDEFMAEITTDRAGIGTHRNCLQTDASKGA
jgi:hypothetical protein